MEAGKLSNQLEFQERIVVSDGAGNERGDFIGQFERSARIQPKFGGETVMAARLSGVQPAVITVRTSNDTKRITTDWRARDVRNGDIWNIRSITVTEDRAGIEMLAERGVASG